jgi:hypothetical protein
MQKRQEPYDACPFCLTPLIPEVTLVKVEKTEKPIKKEVPPDSFDKPQVCPYHFGYLSEQPRKSGFPDECLVCSMLMKCMSAESKASS